MMRTLRLDQLAPSTQRLIWIVAGLALATLPHAPHIAPWILLLTACSAAYRIVVDVQRWPLPPKWLRIAVACAALAGVLLTYRTLNGVEAGTALLVVMAGMKLLETRSVRDLTVILFLAYFALFAGFLYNQQMVWLPYMLLTAWFLTAALMRIHQTTLAMRWGETAWLTGKMFLQALPLAILLFLFFPRLPGQFWAVPARTQAATGISDEISPGDVSELSLSSAIAFRARFEGELPPPEQRYWRGPVLHDFDGRTWRRAQAPFVAQQFEARGALYRYRVTLEPHQRRWIFGLDLIEQWRGRRALRTADYQLLAHEAISTVTAVDLVSATNYEVTSPLPRLMRRADTALPADRNPRSIALARELRARAGSDEAFLQAVLDKFRAENYYYTLEPPRLELHSVDDFLFNTRQGFCEHFASAFTVLARAANIPARIVGGYLGGEYNAVGDYLVVRQADAHAWSEVWLEGRGWVRYDPTAYVAPERVRQGIDAAMAADEPVPGRLIRNSALLSRLQQTWDAANQFWNDQVVAFGEAQQRWLLNRLDIDDAGWEELGWALVISLAAFFATLTAYLAWRFRPQQRDPVAQVYEQLCRKFARHDLARAAHEGPNDYIGRIAVARPQFAAQLSEIRTLYVALRYGPAPLSSQLSRLKFLVSQLSV